MGYSENGILKKKKRSHIILESLSVTASTQELHELQSEK